MCHSERSEESHPERLTGTHGFLTRRFTSMDEILRSSHLWRASLRMTMLCGLVLAENQPERRADKAGEGGEGHEGQDAERAAGGTRNPR